MYYNNNFKKSILILHKEFIKNKEPIKKFINLIKKIFCISRSTFYNWFNNEEIIKTIVTKDYKNSKITPIVEEIIIINKDKNIKKIKEDLKRINIKLSNKAIRNVLKSSTDKKIEICLKNKSKYIEISNENEKFIIENSLNPIKEIVKEFNKKYSLNIHEKQVVNILYKNKKKTQSFYKKTPEIINYIIKQIQKESIITINKIKHQIKNEYNLDISSQLIYNILKEENYVYKKLKKINNPYSIENQKEQLKIVKEKHNISTIKNCVSLDEFSVVINSKPNYGWFKKNSEPNYKIENPKITNKRYSVLMASNNEEIKHYIICEGGIKTNIFIDFMKELTKKIENKETYYLMDNAVIHKTKKFMEYVKECKINILYNAPYHSEINPIENIFSMLRNTINRNENQTIEKIKESIENFKKVDNKEKFKNIFNHNIKMLDEFINKN